MTNEKILIDRDFAIERIASYPYKPKELEFLAKKLGFIKLTKEEIPKKIRDDHWFIIRKMLEDYETDKLENLLKKIEEMK